MRNRAIIVLLFLALAAFVGAIYVGLQNRNPDQSNSNANKNSNDKVEIKANPPEKRVVLKKEISVPPTVEWFPTGLDVTGKYVRLTAKPGLMWTNTIPGDPGGVYGDAKGNPVGTSWPGVIVPDQPLRTLVGKTNTKTFGFAGTYTIEGDFGNGQLFLSMNDVKGTFRDNGGASQQVTVEFLE